MRKPREKLIARKIEKSDWVKPRVRKSSATPPPVIHITANIRRLNISINLSIKFYFPQYTI